MSTPPLAPQHPRVLAAHGDERQDPWFWLRERENPDVVAYLEAENAFTEESLAHLAPLREALFEEMRARILETDMSVPIRRGPWWYYGRTEEGKSYGIHCRRAAGADPSELPPKIEAGDGEQVLLDENAMAQGYDYFAVGTAAVSPDHQWLAFGVDTEGDEQYLLQFKALADGLPTTPEQIPETGYGLAWSRDGSFVFYLRLDEALRPFQLWRHRVRTDPSEDVLVFEEPDRRFSLGCGLTRDESYIVVALHSTNTNEWLAIPSDDPEADPVPVLPRREGIEYAVDHVTLPDGSGWFVALINDTDKDFRVISISDEAISNSDGAIRNAYGSWKEIVPPRAGVRIEDVDAFTNALVLGERAEAETRVRVVPIPSDRPDPFGQDLLAASWTVDAIETPSSTWAGANAEPTLTSIRIGRTSLITPSSVLQVDLDTRHETLLKQEPVLGEFDPARYTTSRLWATARDGTRVPISLVHARDLPLPAPTLLYGYGAYEISIDPSFSHHRLSLLDRGVVFAIAHIRGGGEMGRRWYEDGRMEHKANTFNDFVDAGRFLVEQGIARPDALAGRGGSAGGLLIGVVANEAPELFRALVAQVPFVDVVTTMMDAELPLTVGEWEEWGNPIADEAAYRRMLSYSPYDNVTGTTAGGSPRTYPDLLVTGGLNDPRVSYWEPAKWVAKLRDRSPSTRVLLKTEMGAGHGGPSGRYDAWKEEALVMAFLLDVFGLAPTAGNDAT